MGIGVVIKYFIRFGRGGWFGLENLSLALETFSTYRITSVSSSPLLLRECVVVFSFLFKESLCL